MPATATMKAIQIQEFNAPFKVSDVPKPKPKAHEVLVKIHAGGFCHTDLMALNNEFHTKLPYIGSHEPAGTITEVGSEVQGYRIGDRVGAISFDGPCGECPDCKAGRKLFCDNPGGMKGITSDGGWAEYMTADAKFLVKIPDAVPFEVAAAHMCAGLTMYGSILNAQLPKSGSVAIVGIGGLGHIGTQIAKALGYTVVAVDTKQEALDLANSFKHKPDICMLARTDDVKSILDKLAEIHPDEYGYRGVDAAIIATDQPPSFKTASELTRKHGKLVLVGQPAEGITMQFYDTIFRDLTLVGSLLAEPERGKELMELVEKEDIKVHITTWKPEQAEEMRQQYLRGQSKGKNVIVF
ncbi:MAG: hypothetical protein M1818_008367 [Claussenomyces sp. TS43310]|nr:MAG: hypothetical protein M1818_008367 [Claussenomyces sp. TS43310]